MITELFHRFSSMDKTSPQVISSFNMFKIGVDMYSDNVFVNIDALHWTEQITSHYN